jgi:putative porin
MRTRDLDSLGFVLAVGLAWASAALSAQAGDASPAPPPAPGAASASPVPPASPAPPPPAPPPEARAGLPIRFGASLTIRNDTIDVADQTDLQVDDQTSALRSRFRLWAEYRDPASVVNGALRFGSAQNPNPTASFIRMGNAFRTESFGLDQFYLSIRPLKRRDILSVTAGKMPLPFWRGERGPFRTQLVWDNDISPTGVAGRLAFTLHKDGKGRAITLEDAGGYFIMEDVPEVRFTGLVGKTYLLADQIHLQAPHVGLAAALYSFEQLNAGLRSPGFTPGEGAFLQPGTAAFLMRTGLQVTNSAVNYGPGAIGFLEDRFRIFSATGQVDGGIHVKWLGATQLYALADYVRNTSVSRNRQGYGLTGGFFGGAWKGTRLHPYEAHFTWANMDRDGTLGTYANGDLGAGTDYKGWEVSGNYRATRNLLAAVSYFHFNAAPNKDSFVKRLFLDVTWDF